MNEIFSQGVLIPLWILGAGLVWGIVMSFTAPEPVQDRDRANAYGVDYTTARDRTEPARQPI